MDKTKPETKFFSLKEVGELLVRQSGYTSGLYEIVTEFSVIAGTIGPAKDKRLPGVMLGMSRIGLACVDEEGPYTVDAAKINHAKPVARSRKKSERNP